MYVRVLDVCVCVICVLCQIFVLGRYGNRMWCLCEFVCVKVSMCVLC